MKKTRRVFLTAIITTICARLFPVMLVQGQEKKDLISAATGVNYTPLRDLLAAGKWEEADRETTRAMLQAASRAKEDGLRSKDIDNFPCEDLHIIDQLWLESSKGKFGFSVQKDIYGDLGGTREYNEEVWKNFADRVGWRKEGNWLYHRDLTFNLDAPAGQLPTTNRVQVDFYFGLERLGVVRFLWSVKLGGTLNSYLAGRATTCRITRWRS